MKSAIWFFGAMLLTGLLSSADLTYGQEKKLPPLTISYVSVSGTRSPLWIAKDLGLFEKYGVDANLIYIASGDDLSESYPQLKGRKVSEFVDLTLLKELESEGFFTRLHGAH